MVVQPHDHNFLKKSPTKPQGVMLGLYDICGSYHHFIRTRLGDQKLVYVNPQSIEF